METFSQEQRERMKEAFVDKLTATERGGIDGLIEWLDSNNFFNAPCSTQYHLSCEGGLVRHSLNVCDTIISMARALCTVENAPDFNSLVLVALLHDIGKVGMFGKPNYIENWVKDGRPTKAEPEQKYKISENKPYKTNPDLQYIPHSIRSVEIASKFIDLTEDEEFAIACHDGLYGEMKYVVSGHETPLYLLLHASDMWCSRVLENEEEGGLDE